MLDYEVAMTRSTSSCVYDSPLCNFGFIGKNRPISSYSSPECCVLLSFIRRPPRGTFLDRVQNQTCADFEPENCVANKSVGWQGFLLVSLFLAPSRRAPLKQRQDTSSALYRTRDKRNFIMPLPRGFEHGSLCLMMVCVSVIPSRLILDQILTHRQIIPDNIHEIRQPKQSVIW
jgi:hypothetical protein